MPIKNNRPIFLDLTRIHLPITAVVSFAHRTAGIILFLGVPFAIYLLDLSLRDQRGFDEVRDLLDHVPGKAAIIVILWALTHHSLAGVRMLLIDIGIGVEKGKARRSAWIIAVCSFAVLTIFVGIWLW